MFERPFLLSLQKTANLCCEYVDQPLFCHTIPSQLAQSFFSKPPGMKSQSHLAQVHICYITSSLGFQCPYSISLPPQPQSSPKFLSWKCPPRVIGVIFFLVSKKIRKHLLNGLCFLSVVVTFLYSQFKNLQEKLLLFCVLSSPSRQLCCSQVTCPPLVKGIGLLFPS